MSLTAVHHLKYIEHRFQILEAKMDDDGDGYVLNIVFEKPGTQSKYFM